MLLLSNLFVIRGKVTVEAVVVRQEVRRRRVRVVHQSIVHVFVIRTDSLPKPHLFNTLSVFLPSTLLSGAWLHIVISVVELCGCILLLLLLLLTIGIVVLLLHSHHWLVLLLLVLHHF